MHEDMPPRVVFNDFTDIALNLSVIFWYHPADWWAYCEFLERLNMQILRRFNDEGINTALPVQDMPQTRTAESFRFAAAAIDIQSARCGRSPNNQYPNRTT